MRRFAIACGDAVAFYGALLLTLVVRYGTALDGETVRQHAAWFTPVCLLWLTFFYATRLYDRIGPETITSLLNRTASPLLINLAIAIGYFYAVSARSRWFVAAETAAIAPRTNLVIFFALFAILFLAWRRIAGKAFGEIFRERVVIVGSDEYARRLAEILRSQPEYGYQIVSVIPESEWSIESAERLVRDAHVTSVIASMHAAEKLTGHLTNLAALDVDFWDLASFYESRLERIPLALIRETWFLENIIRREPRLFLFTKHAFDRLAALTFLTITLPLWLLIVITIRLTSPGPVLYRQTRVGKGGTQFTLFKFRTMRPDAEPTGAVWAEKDDPRIIPVGRVLRKVHLDELPQLWNILRGDMSFVGPRPERPEFVEALRRAIPFYDVRHAVKPGLTGWAQLNFRYGASIEDAKEKLEYDLYYIKNRSLALDLAIILKTLSVILRGGTGR
jgi:exopolysaccharide biosynthesis polyprenyl glycosylphosphotransferase